MNDQQKGINFFNLSIFSDASGKFFTKGSSFHWEIITSLFIDLKSDKIFPLILSNVQK